MKNFSHRVKPGRPAIPPITRYLDIKGQRFGNLIVLDHLHYRDKKSWWSCLCDCGGPASQIVVRGDKLTGGQTKCCSCRMAYKKSAVTARPVRIGTTQDGGLVLSAPYVPPPRRVFTPEELAAAELLSARQMLVRRVPLYEIAAYLGCDKATAKQRLAA